MRRHTALIATHEDDGAHRGRKLQADGVDGERREAYGVVDGEAGAYVAAGAGDKDGNGRGGIGGLEQANLLAQIVRHRTVDVAHDGKLATGEQLVVDGSECYATS